MTLDAEPKMRAFAAWIIGTAIQNNPKAQEHVLVIIFH
jgi:hypothetical protein